MIGLCWCQSLTHMLTPTKHFLFPPPTWSMRARSAGCMNIECERWREHHLSLSCCQLQEAWANKLLYFTKGSPPCCLRKGKLPIIVPWWTGCAARSPSSCYVQLSNAFMELVLPSTDLTMGLMWTMSCPFKIKKKTYLKIIKYCKNFFISINHNAVISVCTLVLYCSVTEENGSCNTEENMNNMQ